MKKSEVLKILGDYVINFYVEVILESDFLVVEAKALTAYHMAFLDKYILSIDATEKKSLRVHFCGNIEID